MSREFAPNGTPNEQVPGYGVAGGANGGVGANYSDATNGGSVRGSDAGPSGYRQSSTGAGGSFGSLDQMAGVLAFAYPDPTYGDLTNALEGGSGGGGGGASSGYLPPPIGGRGAGGGALEIGALTDLIFAATADIEADRSRGGDYGANGGGGGSGVLIHAFDISIVAGAIITANGCDPGHLGVGG
jgi:hypothetical protein